MLKLNVGLSRKVGEANYGSRGASVNLELEVEAGLANDPDALRERARHLFRMARAAVDEELNGGSQPAEERGHNGNGSRRTNGSPQSATDHPRHDQTNGQHGSSGNGYRATDKQRDYIEQLARQVRGLGVRRLDVLADRMFGKPAAELSSLDASVIIDMLKAIKDGTINLDDALNGAAT